MVKVCMFDTVAVAIGEGDGVDGVSAAGGEEAPPQAFQKQDATQGVVQRCQLAAERVLGGLEKRWDQNWCEGNSEALGIAGGGDADGVLDERLEDGLKFSVSLGADGEGFGYTLAELMGLLPGVVEPITEGLDLLLLGGEEQPAELIQVGVDVEACVVDGFFRRIFRLGG